MVDLSIIVPFVNEYPQVCFTIQSLFQELRDKVDFEVIAVSNFCPEVAKQGCKEDKGYRFLTGISQKSQPWLKVLKYTDKLSHWNAKNIGVKEAKGDILFFCDAHCSLGNGSLYEMFKYYKENHEKLDGTLNLPLSYLLERPGRELIYRLVQNIKEGTVHYSFAKYRESNFVYQVPCMSTCGMMITKKMLVDDLGLWPTELGIYGGGENFINFTLAVLGKTVNIFPTKYPLYHYAEKRSYSWNSGDWMRNRIIASFIHSGPDFAKKTIEYMKGHLLTKRRVIESILYNESLIEHRKKIESKTTKSIEEFCQQWS